MLLGLVFRGDASRSCTGITLRIWIRPSRKRSSARVDGHYAALRCSQERNAGARNRLLIEAPVQHLVQHSDSSTNL